MNDDRTPHFHEPSLTLDQYERLGHALRLIDGVADELSDSEAVCETCGATRKHDWHQYQAKVKLEGVHKRVMALINANLHSKRKENG